MPQLTGKTITDTHIRELRASLTSNPKVVRECDMALMKNADDETAELIQFARRKCAELYNARDFFLDRITELESENQKLRDELAMYREALDDWDWAGMARDRRDDGDSIAASAFETIARVDAARKEAK